MILFSLIITLGVGGIESRACIKVGMSNLTLNFLAFYQHA